VGFSIQKQRPQEEFQFTSPTSVASVRGTGGSFAATDSSDTLMVIEGVVSLLNRRSGRSIDILPGFIGYSNPDGTMDSRPATPDERKAAEAVSGNGSVKKLEFELRDNQGKSKKLHIDIKE
jgi:hypothetical protein